MRPSTRTLIEDVAARHGTTPTEILSHRHPRLLLAARVEIAKELAARGYYGSQIGAVMKRDWTTVYFYLGRTAKKQPAIKPPKPPSVKSVKAEPPKPQFPIRYAGWDPRESHQ